jgi:hypothetical protein
MADLETVHATIDHTGITGVGGAAKEIVVVSRTGQTNLTTTSSSFVDMDGTNLTAAVTTPAAGARYRITLQGRVACSDATGVMAFDFTLDGTRLVASSSGGSGARLISNFGANKSLELSIVHYTTSLTAGAHTIKPQWRTSLGTATAVQGTDEMLQFVVEEL